MMAGRNHEPSSAGFTLVEMLVAVAVFTVLMIGLLNLLDTSTQVSKLEQSLADTQENVRYATYHLMRSARMMGGSIMPFARTGAWVAGEVHDNVGTNFAIFGTNLDNLAGSDVLVLRGFFDVAPFFITINDVNTSAQTVTIREHLDPGMSTERLINDLTPYASMATPFLNRGLIISTPQGSTTVALNQRIGGEYVVAQISGSSGVTGSTPNRQLVLTWTGDATWGALNWDGNALPSGQPDFQTATRAGVLEAYAYYVNRENMLMRLAQRSVGVTGPEPVAINIGNLQVELGIDADADTFLNPATEWDSTPTLAEALSGNGVVAMRLTVLGRTPFAVPDWTEPAATFATSGNMAVPPAGGAGPRHAKWRRMEVAVALRNFL
jgi:prepilin-type N-terminal cleavage/methylation domain-containing protein